MKFVITLLLLQSGAEAVVSKFRASDNFAQAGANLPGDVNSGNFIHIHGISGSGPLLINRRASNNTAASATDNARSGNELRFSGGNTGFIDNSAFSIRDSASKNVATSGNANAVSGNREVFNQIRNESNMNVDSEANNNTANVTKLVQGQQSTMDIKPTAISGSQVQITQIQESTIKVDANSSDNVAKNTGLGQANSGSQNSVKQATDSIIEFNNKAQNNFAQATTAEAIAGAQNNLDEVNGTHVYLSSNSDQNFASAVGGDSVAGTQNNLQIFQGTDKAHSLTINDKATNNNASAGGDGRAIAGSQTNVFAVKDATVKITSRSSGNAAQMEGEGPQPKDAVAGVGINLNNIQSSDIEVDAESLNNFANNSHVDPASSSDAIAGNSFEVATAINSSFDLDLSSKDNQAYAAHGDAVSGNKVKVFLNQGGNSFKISTVSANNNGSALNGDTVLDSLVTILFR
eukprot:TRINITY_DN3351_c0_g1_i3.p1 TRINITY_DN3351_c0_g1~~TRINITY_DN3351_c0_g1_i3.p1  ORF type:complete len:461 (+),score=62.05 TRINITY_DN3351_c0_g1_i3:146-1528(+)